MTETLEESLFPTQATRKPPPRCSAEGAGSSSPGGGGLGSPAPATGSALENVLRRSDVLRVQAVTTSLLTKRVTPRELFRHIVDGAADCLNADEASLMLREGDVLRVVSGRVGPEHATIRLSVTRIGEGVAGWVAQEGTAVLLNEGDDLSRFAKLAHKGGRIQSAVSVPLQVEGRVVGVLNANRLAGRENFTEEALVILRLFADTAALAIDQMNLLQTVQTRARALQTLLAVSETFREGSEPEGALRALLPSLGETFRPGQVLAFLGTGQGSLGAAASWSPGQGVRGRDALAALELELTPEVSRALEVGEHIWIRRLSARAAPDTSLPARFLVIPVCEAGAQSRCALAIGWEDPQFSPPVEDLHVLEGLARQIGLALSRRDRAAAVGALEAEMAQARAHLVEAERLASIGQSMAGVVHDINAPLTAVTAFAQLIQKDSTEPKTRERVGHIVEASQRAQRLVRELLTVARPHPPSLEPVDLHKLLRDAMDLERPQCSAAAIKLVSDFDDNLLPVRGDPHRLGQVFLNLLVNARQAMDAADKGDTITIQTRRGERGVEIRVSDNGPGIPAAVKSKIFEWFFTTKPPGEGTGLGLAVSREIILVHGGDVRLEDTPGGGATFALSLPLAETPGG